MLITNLYISKCYLLSQSYPQRFPIPIIVYNKPTLRLHVLTCYIYIYNVCMCCYYSPHNLAGRCITLTVMTCYVQDNKENNFVLAVVNNLTVTLIISSAGITQVLQCRRC